jgi:hypothetical protein
MMTTEEKAMLQLNVMGIETRIDLGIYAKINDSFLQISEHEISNRAKEWEGESRLLNIGEEGEEGEYTMNDIFRVSGLEHLAGLSHALRPLIGYIKSFEFHHSGEFGGCQHILHLKNNHFVLFHNDGGELEYSYTKWNNSHPYFDVDASGDSTRGSSGWEYNAPDYDKRSCGNIESEIEYETGEGGVYLLNKKDVSKVNKWVAYVLNQCKTKKYLYRCGGGAISSSIDYGTVYARDAQRAFEKAHQAIVEELGVINDALEGIASFEIDLSDLEVILDE